MYTKRPPVLLGETKRVKMGCGNVYITLNHNEEKVAREVFMRVGKSGGCQACLLQAIGRLSSLILKGKANKERLIYTLDGLYCPEAQPGDSKTRALSCMDALSKLLKEDEVGQSKEEEKANEI